MRTVLIINPTAGSSALAESNHPEQTIESTIVNTLQEYGYEVAVRHTTPDDAGHELARQAVEEGAELIIAAGGDGTIHAVASALVGNNSTLAIVPVGTMNNIARSLEIPEDIKQACQIIAQGETRTIDVGTVNGNVFLEVVGIGLEAAIFPAAEEIKQRGWRSTLHGIVESIKTLFSFQPARFTISFDRHKKRSYRALQISICNTPYYGARLQFAPQAVMDDGLLDVLIYSNFSKIEFIRHAIAISQGKRDFTPHLRQRKVQTLSISSKPPVKIHADGEPVGITPATITIRPGVLRVRVPQQIARGTNVTPEQVKQTGHYQQVQAMAACEQTEERGSLYVK